MTEIAPFPPLPPLPPLPPPVAVGSGGGISLSDFSGRVIGGVLAACLVVVVCIGIASYKFIKKVTLSALRNLKNILNNAPPPPEPNVEALFEEAVDAETMEKLFQEITKEKPVKFTAQQLYTFTSNFSTQLNCGGFGEIYKGEFPNGVKIAVKLLKLSLSNKRVEEQFMAEVGSICKIYHINLVRLYGFCYEDSMAAIVLEFMGNGSLDEYLFGRRQDIEWGKLHDIAIGTARGLAYLHEECQPRIIHYDIRPPNIFLDANFCPKVGNFGQAKLSNIMDNTQISVNGYKGTHGYSAPEFMLTNYPITEKCDVYSYGMMLFEIIGGKSNAGMTVSKSTPYWLPQHVWVAYEKGQLTELVVGCGIGEEDREKASKACEVALWCVQDSSNERPPMSAVVKMLEGGVEIMSPPKPFQYSNLIQTTRSSQRTNSTSSNFSTSTENNSQWYRETNPIMRGNEIQSASS